VVDSLAAGEHRHPDGRGFRLLVLDIDLGGDEALAALMVRYGSLPETREVKTGRGRQLWFKHPGVSIRCNAGALGQGLDIRGDGGYIIAPPSLHPNGQRYHFLNDFRFAELPDWLIMLLAQAKTEATQTMTSAIKFPQVSVTRSSLQSVALFADKGFRKK